MAENPDELIPTRWSLLQRLKDWTDQTSFDLDAAWEAEWEKNLMDAAIEKVKRQVNLKQWQIYDLYVLKQWSVKKVTATLDVNFGQVYLAKHRISVLLKEELKKLV